MSSPESEWKRITRSIPSTSSATCAHELWKKMANSTATTSGLAEMEPVATSQSRLTAEGLHKYYGRRRVVNDVIIHVNGGEVVGLLGPNGAGKTTTFYMIVGMVRANEGAIRLDASEITHMPMYKRARMGIGYLPQEPSIFRGMSVEDNLMAVIETMSYKRSERKQVLDEPFTSINPLTVQDPQMIVGKLKERGLGILITDHNVRDTLSITDRAYIMYEGAIKRAGTAAELAADAEVREIYLGSSFRL